MKKRFTDLYIHRPVLATVISLLIFVFGLASIDKLVIRQYPKIDSSTVMITTSYPGANQSLVQGFVTAPIESAIAGVEGIDYITSSSNSGSSSISVHLKLGYDVNTAVNEINSQIQSIRYKLPTEIRDPVVSKDSQKGNGIIYLAYYSKTLSPEQIIDYLNRVVVPDLQTVSGVAQAEVMGAGEFAMRIWLNPIKMAAYHVTPQDITTALNQHNVLAAPGNIKGKDDEITIRANTNLSTAQAFGNIVVKNNNGHFVRMRDVAKSILGPSDTDFNMKADGQNAVVISISALSTANPLDVAKGVRALLPKLKKQFPPALSSKLLYDASIFIDESIDSVIKTIVEAMVIVLIVIFLFLGTLRAVIIPIVTVPLSLVGICTFMLWLGFSINVLTLLAMVMAIGLVVDDAIIVVENINRHLEMGQTPINAALQGAHEIAMPVITMTTTLAAVFLPIGFMGGLTGRLFEEFAFVLAGTVIISGVVALTLSPMMCSKLLRSSQLDGRFVKKVDAVFEKVKNFYARLLTGAMNSRGPTVLFALIVLIACFVLYGTSKQDLAPQEDQNFMIISSTGPTNANIDYTTRYMNQLSTVLQNVPEKETDMTLAGMNGINTGFSFMIVKPASERKRSIFQIQQSLMAPLGNITGLQSFPILPPTLPGTAFGLPVQFVLQTIGSYSSLNSTMQQLILKAQQSGLFAYVDSDLKFNKPEVTVDLDRNMASGVGVTPETVANALGTMINENNVTRIDLQGRSYEVIPQVPQMYRLNPRRLNQYTLQNSNKDNIPLSALIHFGQDVQPNGLNQFQQLNSATFLAQLKPGVSTDEALSFLQQTADSIMPKGMSYDYDGQLRQYIEQPAVAFVFGFALIFIFLILSAQFESFREPLVILISVPMSLFGALIFLNVGLGSINIFTKIGLITLIGLIAKQGILIVQFANQVQEEDKLSARDAVIKAAAIRLRPILMTTAAMVFGIAPLMFTDVGLVRSEFQLGLVVVSGILIGTLFTLFVVPVFYSFLAKDYNEKAIQ